MSVVDLAKALAPNCDLEIIGIRPGEKLHEQMIGSEDAYYTYEYNDYYKILPAINDWSNAPERIKDGIKVDQGFTYCSDNNQSWMSADELRNWVSENRMHIGKI